MKILGIESSCDESAVAIISVEDGKATKEIELIATHNHQAYGGVIPESASRQHFFFLPKMIETLNQQYDLSSIDLVATTYGPGHMGGLLMGLNVGKAIAVAFNKPFLPVDHIKAHALSAQIENPALQFPYVCLLISGGHTLLLKVQDFYHIDVLARTRDDAMGELLDKVANYLGLGFPGGRIVEQKALTGIARFAFKLPQCKNKTNKASQTLDKITHNNDFSFSGLKTAFINLINSLPKPLTEQDICDICASLIKVVCMICKKKMEQTYALHPNIKQYTIAGGVASSKQIREIFQNFAQENKIEIFFPSLALCTDNATMIAWAGYLSFLHEEKDNIHADAKSSLGW